jgi:hypothetical protein
LYDSIIAMIVESYAPYTVACVLNLGLTVANNSVKDALHAFFGYTQVCIYLASSSRTLRHWGVSNIAQVIAPLLVIKSASGSIQSMHFRSLGESRCDGGSIPGRDQASSAEVTDWGMIGESGVGDENVIEEAAL